MSVEALLTERGGRYGSFADNAHVAQSIKAILRAHVGWEKLNNEQREALDLMAMKMSRIVNGDPLYADNWDDIGGYAALGARSIRP